MNKIDCRLAKINKKKSEVKGEWRRRIEVTKSDIDTDGATDIRQRLWVLFA